MSEAGHIADACRLLHCAMTRSSTPINDDEYGALFERYRTVVEFRQAVQAAAEGQGLQIYASHHEYGLLLVNKQGGFFCPRLVDFNDRMTTANERLAFGVLFYLLAAFVYRTPEAVAEDFGREVPFRLSQVVNFAKQQIQLAKASSPAFGQEGTKIMSAVDFLSNVPEGGKDAPRKSLRGMLQHILDYYVEHGLFAEEKGLRQLDGADGDASTERPTVYRPRPGYRVQVRMMTNEGATALIQFLRDTPPA